MRCVWLALLLLSALSVCAEPQSSQLIPASDEDAALLRSGVEEMPQHFEEFVENATLSAAFSGCGLCQQTGQCDHAFRGQPGQFCIGLASGAPCCCPRDAQCAASPYECRCRRVVPTYHYGGDDYHPSSSSGGVSGTLIFFALLLPAGSSRSAGEGRAVRLRSARCDRPVWHVPRRPSTAGSLRLCFGARGVRVVSVSREWRRQYDGSGRARGAGRSGRRCSAGIHARWSQQQRQQWIQRVQRRRVRQHLHFQWRHGRRRFRRGRRRRRHVRGRLMIVAVKKGQG